MPITTLPTPPNTGDPDTFNPRSNAFFGAMPQFGAELNAMAAAFGPGNPYCAVTSGTNGLIVSSGLNLTALVVGQIIRFRAINANTGPATINLDGRGARPCVTVTGAALPAGYVRTDVTTTAEWDGTSWIVDRQRETGTNANGRWTREADGTLTCRHILTGLGPVATASGGEFLSDSLSWPYPATYSAIPAVSIQGQRDNVSPPAVQAALGASYLASQAFWLQCAASQSVTSFKAVCLAQGRWY